MNVRNSDWIEIILVWVCLIVGIVVSARNHGTAGGLILLAGTLIWVFEPITACRKKAKGFSHGSESVIRNRSGSAMDAWRRRFAYDATVLVNRKAAWEKEDATADKI